MKTFTKTSTPFRPYDRDQLLLLPPDMREWLGEDDLVYFILDTVGELDLSAVFRRYSRARGGQPPYNPAMMTALVLYAYCVGMPSSRKIEEATYRSVAFRVLTADQHPDHDTIADFRKRHLAALADLFVQVLRLCQKAGLARLGHVALDGTKIRANASKHKAMSYARMEKSEAELEAQVLELLERAEACDAEEDALYGKGRRGEDLPEELRRRTTRLAKIREAKSALEQEARAKAEAGQAEYEAKKKAHEERGGRGRPPTAPSDKPSAKAQRNFTDPESRIMVDGATKAFEQAYNAQAAVDCGAQVIVACAVTQEANDKRQIAPMIEKIQAGAAACAAAQEQSGKQKSAPAAGKTQAAAKNMKPKILSADSGYFSEANIATLAVAKVDAYIATGRQKHGEKTAPAAPRGRIPKDMGVKERMARKLRTLKGRATYARRKSIVEPVFGQIKEARGFRRFTFRGLAYVACEWNLICLTHNLLKVFRSGWRLQTA